MTEAKSPREIAEDITQWRAMFTLEQYRDQTRTAIEQALLSYAAERERLLASLIEAAAGVSVLGVIPMEGQHISNDEADERQEKLRTALSRLSSRPATEGKGDD